MAASQQLLALFHEVDAVVEVVDDLQRRLEPDGVTLLTSVPLPAQMLGRPATQNRIPRIGLMGALVGLGVALFLNVGTPLLYPIRVGGQPLIAIPTSIVLTFELTMLGLLVSTFLGVLWSSRLPPSRPRPHAPAVMDGQIGVLVRCPPEERETVRQLLLAHGAEAIVEPEERLL